LSERDDDPDQLRQLFRDRGREQLVQLAKDPEPDRADTQRRRTAPFDPQRRVAVQPQRPIAHDLYPEHVGVPDESRFSDRQGLSARER